MWMVFFKEADLQHYLYNGIEVIPINPHRETVTYWTLDPGMVPTGKTILDSVLDTPRVHSFTVLKARYRVINKGKFVSE